MIFELSGPQIRAARALLGWSLGDLAASSGVGRTTLVRLESDAVKAREETLSQLRRAFENNDIQFLPDDGVKRRIGEMDRLVGHDALPRFFDDVFETVKNGGDLCVSGVNEKLFAQFNVSEESAAMHRTRMTAIKDKISFRVLLKEGDFYFRNDTYIQYRWIPREFFYDHPIYVYENKLAFIKFDRDNLEILRIDMPSMAMAFRVQFNFLWEHAKLPPKQKD